MKVRQYDDGFWIHESALRVHAPHNVKRLHGGNAVRVVVVRLVSGSKKIRLPFISTIDPRHAATEAARCTLGSMCTLPRLGGQGRT